MRLSHRVRFASPAVGGVLGAADFLGGLAMISDAHRMQQMVEEDHRAIAQVSYSIQNQVHWLRGLAAYFGDTTLHERLLLERCES